MHVEVKELSEAVRKALDSVSYGARDIEVIPSYSVSGQVAGGAGMRGFVLIINLDTGKFEVVNGSWGGDNILSNSPVDSSNEDIPIPPNGAVIRGTRGHPRTFARIYAHPNATGSYLLPEGNATAPELLSEVEQQAIYCFAAIKGGEYRRDEMRRRNVTTETVDSLVERGYLKRNRAGSVQITTKGKNARTIRH